jgi:hypothetical protein
MNGEIRSHCFQRVVHKTVFENRVTNLRYVDTISPIRIGSRISRDEPRNGRKVVPYINLLAARDVRAESVRGHAPRTI